jgi:hypothetical protein
MSPNVTDNVGTRSQKGSPAVWVISTFNSDERDEKHSQNSGREVSLKAAA